MSGSGKTYQLAVQIAGKLDRSFHTAIKGASSGIGGLASGLSSMAKVAGGVLAVGAGAFMGDSISKGLAFESTMADVAKVVDGLRDENGRLTASYHEMSDALLTMSKNIPMTANELGQITAAAGQAGIAQNELMRFTETAAKMGVAFDTTAEQAGEWMASWRTALGLTQPEVEALGDQINYLGNTTSENALKLSDIVTRVGALGKTAGLTGGELAALGASMPGVPAEIAATGIKNLALAMTEGHAATTKQQQVLQQLGMDSVTLAQRMQTDAKGAILDLLGAIRQLPEAEQSAALTQYFGKESVAAIAPLLSNLENLKTQFDKVGDANQYAGSMNDEYAVRADTTANKIALAKNKIAAFQTQIGGLALPAVGDIADRLGGFVDTVGGALLSGFQSGGMGGLMSVAGSMIGQFVGSVRANIPKVTQTAVSMMQQFGDSARNNIPNLMTTGLVAVRDLTGSLRQGAGTLVDAGIAMLNGVADGLIAGIPVLIQNVPQIVTNIAGIINDNAPKLLMAGVKIIGKLAVGLVQAIPALIQSIPQIIQAIWSAFVAFNWVSLGKSIISGLKDGIISMGGSVKEAAKTILIKIENALRALPGKLREIARQAVTNFANTIRNAVGAVASAAQSIVSNVVGAVSSLPDRLWQAGKDAIAGLASGLWEKAGAAVDAVKQIGSNIIDGAKNIFKINSPSRVMRDQVGVSIPEGIAAGIYKATPDITRARNKMLHELDPVQNSSFTVGITGSNSTSLGRNIGSMTERLSQQAISSNSVNIQFAPEIHVNGSQAKQEVREAVRASFEEFKRMMDRYEREKHRVQFAPRGS